MEKGPAFGGYERVIIHLNHSIKRVVFDPNDVDDVVAATVKLKPDPAYARWKKAVAEDRVVVSFSEFKELETYHG